MTRLWTIQHAAAYDRLRMEGVLRADERYLPEDFRPAYDWMAVQMRTRLGDAPGGVRYPVWAWYQWEGRRCRRDLRCGGYAPRGTPMVQMTFDVPEGSFLLSDFDDWHAVLNDTCLAGSDEEFDAFYARPHSDLRRDVAESWTRVFDLTAPCERASIQATLWEIRLPQVRRAEFFIAK